jgi:1,4-dihydroxy-2-naphthoyl-CoA synthase
MPFETILFEIDEGVATLTLNRPDKLNSFTGAMHIELREALRRVREDSSVRALRRMRFTGNLRPARGAMGDGLPVEQDASRLPSAPAG